MSPHVKLSPYAHPGKILWRGTRTELDGVEIQDVRDIKLHFPVDGIATLDLELFICEPFVWEGDADVHFHLVVPDGYVLCEETDPQGRKRYWAVPAEDVDDGEQTVP